MSVTEICAIHDLRGISDTDFRTLMVLERFTGMGVTFAPVERLAEHLEVSPAEAVEQVRSLVRRAIIGPMHRGKVPKMPESELVDAIYGNFQIGSDSECL